MAGGRLVKKALALFKKQPTPGADPVPSPLTDAIMISEPEYSVDPEVLKREFLTATLTPNPILLGRKMSMLKFKVEMKGNGKQHSGDVADACIVARMLEACAFKLTGYEAATPFSKIIADYENSTTMPDTVAAHSGATTLTEPVVYTVAVTTAGASATAKVTVTSNSPHDVPAGGQITLTSGTPFALGAKGGSLALTWAGDAVMGSKWRVLVAPQGVVALPVSDNFELGTLYYYQDGVLHKILDAMGTVSLSGEAGKFASYEFTFTGKYADPEDEAFPDLDDIKFETPLPPLVENSNLTWGSNTSLIVNDYSFDLSGEITPRPSVNHKDGFYGMRFTARTPKGGFNPEAELEASQPFWSDMAAAKRRQFFTKIGTVPGNIIGMFQPSAQTDTLGYGDRDGISTYEVGLALSGDKGDDEVIFIFA